MYGNTEDKDISIVMWGPPQSGKTWLIDAFCHKVNIINEKLLSPAGEFFLSLKKYEQPDELVEVDVSDGPDINPTQNVKTTEYQFQRQVKKSGLRFEVSTHQHSIFLVDAPGAHTTEQTFRDARSTSDSDKFQNGQQNGAVDVGSRIADNDNDISSQNQETSAPDEEAMAQAKLVQGHIQSANCIILLLDLGLSNPNEFVSDLTALRNNLRGSKRFIAACLTKADRFGTGLEGIYNVEVLRAAVDGRFQSEGKKVLKVLDDMVDRDEHELLLCAVSAAGYTKDKNNRITPNWGLPEGQQDQGKVEWLLNKDDWNPQGVEVPFFWLFQQIELVRLRKSLSVKGGWFQRWIGMYLDARRNDYIAYSKMLEDARNQIQMDQQTMDKILSTRIQTF